MAPFAPRTYRSRIDTWLVVVVLVAMASVVYSSARALSAPNPGDVMIVILVLLVTSALPVWLFLATHYTLTETELLIRSGPFRWKIPVRDIVSVRPTRNPLSSPALSLDRLRIEYGRGRWIMISPRDRDLFLRDLDRLRGSQV